MTTCDGVQINILLSPLAVEMAGVPFYCVMADKLCQAKSGQRSPSFHGLWIDNAN